MPSPFCVISSRAVDSVASSATAGTRSPLCIRSATFSSRRRPSVPPGWLSAKSSGVKPRASRSATASASPIASVAVVLAVGARFSGQASCSTETSRCTSADLASVEPGRPVIDTSGTPMRLISGRIVSTSAVSPEFEMAITASSRVIMPRSPWLASPGWTKKAGVPVEASVAATLPPMWPLLPMPVTTTRPRQPSNSRQARAKPVSMRGSSAETASRSIMSTRRAVPSKARSSAKGMVGVESAMMPVSYPSVPTRFGFWLRRGRGSVT